MKNVWTVISAILFINFVALLVLVGWLHTSGRLSRERYQAAVDIFRPTMEQKRLADEEAIAQAAVQAKQNEQAARLANVSRGTVSLAQRLDANKQADDVAIERINRMQRDKTDIEAYLNQVKVMVEKQRAQLDADRKAFDEALQREQKLKLDKDFQQTVQMYQQLRPKQSKQMFQQLLAQNKTDQVVDYLAAMQLRKAAAILKEFKEGPDINQATDLLQRLRERGIELSTSNAKLAGSP